MYTSKIIICMHVYSETSLNNNKTNKFVISLIDYGSSFIHDDITSLFCKSNL